MKQNVLSDPINYRFLLKVDQKNNKCRHPVTAIVMGWSAVDAFGLSTSSDHDRSINYRGEE
jgi:hypothetical protein